MSGIISYLSYYFYSFDMSIMRFPPIRLFEFVVFIILFFYWN